MPKDNEDLASSDHPIPALSPFEILADELGTHFGRVERENVLKFAALAADLGRRDAERDRRDAERELRLAAIERAAEQLMTMKFAEWEGMVKEKLASLRDGKDGQNGAPGPQGEKGLDGQSVIGPAGPIGPEGQRGSVGPQGEKGASGESIVGPRGEKGEQGEKGEPGLTGEKGDQGAKGERGDAGETIIGPAGPVGPQGERGDRGVGERGAPGDVGAKGEQGEKGEAGESIVGPRGEKGEQGPLGKLPIAKEYVEGEAYLESEVVYCSSGTYQALRTTGRPPGHADWACLTPAGMNGKDGMNGRSLRIRGTYDPKKLYEENDCVTLDQMWFAARKDNPGPCPGDDWQIGPKGKRGDRGEKGERGLVGPEGKTGKDGREVAEWVINYKEFTVTPIMSDGYPGTALPFYKLLEQFKAEIS